MGKQVLALLFVCLAAVIVIGCGGEGTKVEVSETVAPLDRNPALQDALRAEEAGESLSGKQKRLLKDAEQEGIIE